MNLIFRLFATLLIFTAFPATSSNVAGSPQKTRVIVTTDGEEDDRASMVRFLLYTNDFDVEGIINCCSQFHWLGCTGWNAFHPVEWIEEYIRLYATVYPNLLLHDKRYPSPDKLLNKWKVGNISAVGDYSERSDGARLIADVILDESDPRPVWVQAWGGCNTLAAALKIIQDDYPDKMEYAASKLRLFLIWEQDNSYQEYIRPNWERFNIPTIISDQFDCMAYIWHKVLPQDVQRYFDKEWTTRNITEGHGPLCDSYYNNHGAFNAEGDTPAFLHCIDTGLRNMESPGYGGWGGRYIKIRNNVWMDPSPSPKFIHPEGQRFIVNSWSKEMEHYTDSADVAIRTQYFLPMWRWMKDIQNDFAARANWCVKDYASANHHPIIRMSNDADICAKAGEWVNLDASMSEDPDGDKLSFNWYTYPESGTYPGDVALDSDEKSIEFKVPEDARKGDTIHVICKVSDNGEPRLTKYRRIIISVK